MKKKVYYRLGIPLCQHYRKSQFPKHSSAMFNPKNHGLIGSMFKFMNKVKAAPFSWNATSNQNPLTLDESPLTTICIKAAILQNLVYSAYLFFLLYNSSTSISVGSRQTALKENFFLILFSVGLLMCAESFIYQYCKRREIVEFFQHVLFLDIKFNGRVIFWFS